MSLIKRFVPFLSALLLAIFFIIWQFEPMAIVYLGPAILVILIVTILIVTDSRLFNKTFFNFISNPFFFIFGASLFFLLIDNQIIRQIYILLIVFGYALILQNIYSFFHQTADYQPYALENIYSYINLATFFLFCSSFFGINILLDWPLWIFIILVFFFSIFLFTRTLWSHKVEWHRYLLFIVTLGLVSTESFYIMSLLPTSYLFNALIVIIVYYLLMNVMRDYMLKIYSWQNTKKYLIISLIIIIAGFLTTRWY